MEMNICLNNLCLKSLLPRRSKFDGSISLEDLQDMLSSRQMSKGNKTMLEGFTQQSAPEVYNFSPIDCIYYTSHYNGVQLTEQYRQKCPGVFPSQRNVKAFNRSLKRDFTSVLLP